MGQLAAISFDAVAREVLANALNITQQQRENIRIVIGIDRLRKVDELDCSIVERNWLRAGISGFEK